MPRCSWFLAAGLAGVVMVSACSDADDSGSADRAAYVDAFVEAAQSGEAPTDEEQDRCFAESAVDAIGVANLREAGVTPDDVRAGGGRSPADLGVDVSDDQGADYFERLQGCMDVRGYLVDAVVASGVVADESVDCLEQAFDDNLVRSVVISDFVEGRDAGASEVADQLEAVYVNCAPESG